MLFVVAVAVAVRKGDSFLPMLSGDCFVLQVAVPMCTGESSLLIWMRYWLPLAAPHALCLGRI